MLRLEVVDDLETLRKAALLLQAENQRLVAKNVELNRKVLELQGLAPEQLQLKLAELQRQLDQANRQIFGDSSERRRKKQGQNDKKPQRGHGPKPQPNLRVVEDVCDLGDVADTCCDHCGKPVEEWPGQFEEAEEIDVIRREFVIKRVKRKKARCECHRTIVTAPPPPKLFPGARYSIEFAILVVVAKYVDHAPLERQVRGMARDGLDVDSQTLWDYVYAVARLLRPAHEQLRDYLLTKPVLGADETWWRLMTGKSKKRGGDTKRWHVWAACADDAVYFTLEDTRGLEAARKILETYEGVVMCDGYGVYSGLQNRGAPYQLAHCWSHIRRKLMESGASDEELKPVLDDIDELFAIERRCATGPPGDELRRELRDQLSRPIIDKIKQWRLSLRVFPGSGLANAAKHITDHWSGLTRFLDDPRIPLSNNQTERAIRNPVIGRKNFYGSRSRRGTEAAAILYSLVESARLAGVEPAAYLRAALLAAIAEQPIPLPHEIAAGQN